jgi:predicted type IV restriction endonuclease
MVRATSITETLLTPKQVQEKFGLRRSENNTFFSEWFEGLPDLTDIERERVDQLKRKCLYHLEDGALMEETVKMLVLSPLLDLAGFYDPPFRLKTETPVRFELEEGEEILQGRIDALVIQQQFWAVVIEAKRTSVGEQLAIPQTLAYMMANPYPERSVFGMITNGANFIFLKLFQGEYSVSRVFSLVPLENELLEVIKILKRIGSSVIQ